MVHLTEEETKEALRAAREKKFYQLKQAEYRERLNKAKMYPSFTALQLFEYFSMQLTVDEDNANIVEQLCKYFAADNAFDGDLSKGLFLMGPVGVGKTSMMKFFMKNQVSSYRVDSCRDVESRFSVDGEECIDYYSFNLNVAINADPFGHQSIGFCFDDLGTESNSKHFGKEKNVMAEIILNRYDNQLPFNTTHITTNLTADKIKEQYGTRVTDRLREMFNVVQFGVNTKSRRQMK